MRAEPEQCAVMEMRPSRASTRFNNELRYRAEDHEAQTQLTPAYVLEPVREALGGRIVLDPCTTPENPVGAERFYTPPVDGAAEPWDADTIWVNPPYGSVRDRWVERCVDAAQVGSKVVLLMPAATDTRIFQFALSTASTSVLIRGRLKFGILRPNLRQVAASHPSALIGWNVDLAPCAELGDYRDHRTADQVIEALRLEADLRRAALAQADAAKAAIVGLAEVGLARGLTKGEIARAAEISRPTLDSYLRKEGCTDVKPPAHAPAREEDR